MVCLTFEGVNVSRFSHNKMSVTWALTVAKNIFPSSSDSRLYTANGGEGDDSYLNQCRRAHSITLKE